MLDAVLLLELFAVALLVVVGAGDFFSVGEKLAVLVPDGAHGQIGVDGGGFLLRKLDIGAAEVFDDGRHAVEIDGHVILNVHFEIAVDGVHTVVRGIDPGGVFSVFIDRMAVAVGNAGVVHPVRNVDAGVAGDGSELDGTVKGVDGKNHLDIGTLGVLVLILEKLLFAGAADIQAQEENVDDVIRQVLIQLQLGRIDAFVDFKGVGHGGQAFLGEFVFHLAVSVVDNIAVLIQLHIFLDEFIEVDVLLVIFGQGEDGKQQGKAQQQRQ